MHTRILISAAILLAAGAHATDPAAGDDAEQQAGAAADLPCIQQTGTRIKPRDDQPCINAAGQVITREQIERSGAIDAGEALRRISPLVN